jgi:hypothetical protein
MNYDCPGSVFGVVHHVTILVEIAMTRVSNDIASWNTGTPGRILIRQNGTTSPFSFSVCFNTRGQSGNQYLINLQPVHIHYFE